MAKIAYYQKHEFKISSQSHKIERFIVPQSRSKFEAEIL